MKIQDGYMHAHYRYSPITLYSYLIAIIDIIIAQLLRPKNITFHFPIEIAFPSQWKKYKRGIRFINIIEQVAGFFHVSILWENISWLHTHDWSLKEQMQWKKVPPKIKICFDTGHAMLGTKNPRAKITQILTRYGDRIKHIHLHENDLLHDLHLPPHKHLTKPFVNQIIKNRTWIIEKSS